MNNFASSLLSLLLSFTRSLANGALSLFQGTSGSFLGWIGKHWIVLACVLVLAGWVTDAIVYILRWRPQYVWRSFWHRLFRSKDDRQAEQRFDEGYDQGLGNYPFMDEPIPDVAESPDADPLFRAITHYDVSTSEASQPEDASASVVRRRRSARHSRRFRIFRRHAASRSENSASSSASRTRDAFHEVIYPSLQQQNGNQSSNGGNPYE